MTEVQAYNIVDQMNPDILNQGSLEHIKQYYDNLETNKLNKSIIAILLLTSLLFSALGAAYYFYTKHQRALNTTNELKTVYIAAKDIKKNKKILAMYDCICCT